MGLDMAEWNIPTKIPGTLVIAVSFIVLAYAVHPFIDCMYRKARAGFAWRTLELQHRVEITPRAMAAEVFGCNCRWNAVRIVTVLMAGFYLLSWGLELTVTPAPCTEEACADIQPPPVMTFPTQRWEVINSTNTLGGELNCANFKNLNPKEAKSSYYVVNFVRTVYGNRIVATWDTDWNAMKNLKLSNANGHEGDDFYMKYEGREATALVDGIHCSARNESEKAIPVFVNGSTVEWGTVLHCKQGPRFKDTNKSQPAVVLNSTQDETYVIVEETASDFSFVYSVWTTNSVNATEITYFFHMASNVRLAEAIVTGIVNGVVTDDVPGYDCFCLVRAFSERYRCVGGLGGGVRAQPFGEIPIITTANLQDTENIIFGVQIVAVGTLFVIWMGLLIFSFFVAWFWSICGCCNSGIDVFNSMELLLATSHQSLDLPYDPTMTRAFVEMDSSGNLTVVFTRGDAQSHCASFVLRRRPEESVLPAQEVGHIPRGNDEIGGAPLPVGRRRVYVSAGRFA